MSECPAQTGPIWKFDGEPCGCTLVNGHDGDHECSCGSWWVDSIRRDRGYAGAIALLFAILAVAPLGAMRWLGPVWAGGLVVAVALVWLAVECCTAPAGLRDRLDAEAPKGGGAL